MYFNYCKKAFLVYLAALAAFAPFSIDIYLASMPSIQKQMNATITQVQLTLSLFFIGFAAAQLFWGPLSDRIGRKKTVFIGVSVYVLGSLCCAFSHNIDMLIVSRLIQAIGACVGIVMALAIARDSFAEAQQRSKTIALLMAIAMLAPMIAPVVGSFLLVRFNWQANFYFLVAYGVALLLSTIFLEETYPKLKRKPLPLNKLLRAYAEQLRHVPFISSALASCTNFCVLFAFISSASFIYINIYELSPEWFGYLFSLNAVIFIVGNVLSPKLCSTFSEPKLLFAALGAVFIGVLVMLIALMNFKTTVFAMVLPLMLVSFGVSLLHPKLVGYSIEHVVNYVGITSALAGAVRFMLAAVTGLLMGVLITHSAIPLALVMLVLNVLTVIFLRIYFKS